MPTVNLGKIIGAAGLQGPQGVPGPQGVQGVPGTDGADGVTPNLTAGTTTTLAPGSAATVTRRAGSPDEAPIFDFGIPRGADGDFKSDGSQPMTGDLNLNGHKATGMATPTANTDGANKGYVDAAVSSLVVIPAGLICLWSGAADAVPTGWRLCDGSNGTPDLRDRFVVGAGGNYVPGAKGGADTVTLTANQMPVHGHAASVNASGLTAESAGAHSHSVSTGYSAPASPPLTDRFTYTASGNNYAPRKEFNNISGTADSAGAHTHSVSGNISASIGNAGGGQGHENRPPYYALCYIMKG